jgi:dCTP deaminase
MDLPVGNKVIVHHSDPTRIIDPYEQSRIDSLFQQPETFTEFRFPPGVSALLATEDEVEIPETSEGFIQLRSTWARLGLLSPPTIADPGFHGTLTLEVFNASGSIVLIRPGDSLWSLHLVSASRGTPLYDGRYQGQTGVTIPKALKRKNPDDPPGQNP